MRGGGAGRPHQSTAYKPEGGGGARAEAWSHLVRHGAAGEADERAAQAGDVLGLELGLLLDEERQHLAQEMGLGEVLAADSNRLLGRGAHGEEDGGEERARQGDAP